MRGQMANERAVNFKGGLLAFEDRDLSVHSLPKPITEEASGDQNFEATLKKDTVYIATNVSFANQKINFSLKLPNYSAQFGIHAFLYDENGNYGVMHQTFDSRKDVDAILDVPLYIMSNEVITLPLVLQNNTKERQVLNIQNPTTINSTLEPGQSQQFTIQIDPKRVPYNIEVKNNFGKTLALVQVNPLVVKPGIQVDSGKSDFVSTLKSNPGSLTFRETLPQSYLKGNSSLQVCNKNTGLSLILDSIEKVNKEPHGCFE